MTQLLLPRLVADLAACGDSEDVGKREEIGLAPDEETKNAYWSKIAVIARDLHALDEEEVAIADRSNRLRQQRELAAEAEQSLERLRARLGQVNVDQRMDIFQTLIESIVVSPGTPRTFQVNLRLQQDSGLELWARNGAGKVPADPRGQPGTRPEAEPPLVRNLRISSEMHCLTCLRLDIQRA